MQKYGFELLEEKNIPEISGTARLWQHIHTGAELLSISNNDENKCFGVTLRTPPKNSTGVAHILEHSVLCGSEKYPVKELFAELVKGSMQTFLNALTFPDKTCYPVASTNLQDFYNLVDVYLDAVFHPRINEDTLFQEGVRIEAPSIDTKSWSLQGVVYNEMKGVYSSCDSILQEASQQSLFANHVYGLDSGGNPKDIPNLSYEEFMDFHKKYYHPTNARFFFWGDDNEDKRLEYLENFLTGYTKLDLDNNIPLMPSFDSPKLIELPYAGEANDNKAHCTINWLMCETSEAEEIFCLEILTKILLGLPGSPLRKAIIESGLCEDIAGVGFETDLRQAYFSIGARSIDYENVQQLELLIFETLAELAESGVDKNDIEAAVNSMEFALRENNTGSFPRGLLALFRSLSTWLYEKDALVNLAWEDDLTRIKKRINQEKLFENLIKKYFLENTHRTTVVIVPDKELNKKNAQIEQEKLEQIISKLNDADKAKYVAESKKLAKMQETPDSEEALASIPSLTLKDLAKENKLLPITTQKNEDIEFINHDLDCQGIVYLKLLFEMQGLDDRLLELVPLYARTLTEFATSKYSFVELGQLIAAKTGGIGAYPSFHKHTLTKDNIAKFIVSGKATYNKIEELLELIEHILSSIKLDNQERFMLMLLEEKARLEQSLVPSGHNYVSLRLDANTSLADNIDERLDGVSYYFYLKDLINQAQNNWAGVLKDLQAIHHYLINKNHLLIDYACDNKYCNDIEKKLIKFVSNLPKHKNDSKAWHKIDFANDEALVTATQVNYVGLGTNLYEADYKFDGSAQVIFRHLRMSYLWEKVRVQGGAYGVFIRFSRVTGKVKLVSYRDPNLESTLEIYKKLPEFLEKIKLSSRDLERAIVGAISDIDTYMLPKAKADTALWRYLCGETNENLQLIREQILNTKTKDFKELAPYFSKALTKTNQCVLGSSKLEAFAQKNNWKIIQLS